MKCKHSRVAYYEQTLCPSTHYITNGKRTETYNGEAGDILPEVTVTCQDCGFQKTYNRRHKSCPKWVKDLHDALSE